RALDARLAELARPIRALEARLEMYLRSGRRHALPGAAVVALPDGPRRRRRLAAAVDAAVVAREGLPLARAQVREVRGRRQERAGCGALAPAAVDVRAVEAIGAGIQPVELGPLEAAVWAPPRMQ